MEAQAISNEAEGASFYVPGTGMSDPVSRRVSKDIASFDPYIIVQEMRHPDGTFSLACKRLMAGEEGRLKWDRFIIADSELWLVKAEELRRERAGQVRAHVQGTLA
jgi:hypothetical protein